MSLRALNWAMSEAPVTDRVHKLLLLAMADHAHDDGTGCYASHKTLADKALCSDRTVRTALGQLEELGLIRRGDPTEAMKKLPPGRVPVTYDLLLHVVKTTPEAASGVKTATEGGKKPGRPRKERPPTPEKNDAHPGSQTSDEPSTNQLQPTTNQLHSRPASADADADAALDAPGSRPEVDELCELLARRIIDNGSKPPTITKQWRSACRRMIDIDGRSPNQIRNMIEWCQGDGQNGWWRPNILSMPTLREKYDQMRLQAQREYQNRPAARVSRTAEVLAEGEARAQAWAERARTGETPTAPTAHDRVAELAARHRPHAQIGPA